ncbi:MAG: galactose mutarotase [Rhizobiales bacterium]|nr:galactose mutarotase [Hyphomicrobiales bacterium]
MLELLSPSLTVRFSTLGARPVAVLFDGIDAVRCGGTDADIMAGDWTAGAVCGRFAGRITKARFALDGVEHKLVPNFGEHQLHGGPDNFGVRHWKAERQGDTIRFSISSPDGDQGFPGAVDATAKYALRGNVLSLDIEARTTKPTVINMTSHAYWNLSDNGNAFDHEMQIDGDAYLPLSEELLPSGEIRKVEGTRWDFRKLRKVAEPYDNCWALDGKRGEMKRGLVLCDPASGRRMEVWTTECGMQMYTALHWNETMPGKGGPLRQYQAIAIEPQNFPDAPTHANFPSAVLRQGEAYRNRIEWRFS